MSDLIEGTAGFTCQNAFLAKKLDKKETSFQIPPYDLEEFGENWPQQRDDLLDLDFLRISTAKDNISVASMFDLQSILRRHSLPISGRKKNLIERIVENIPSVDLQEEFPECRYILTTKGNDLLRRFEANLINRKKGYGFLDSDINITRRQLIMMNKNTEEKDVLWKTFVAKSRQCSSKKEWQSLYFCQSNMSSFLIDIGKHQDSLRHTCFAVIICLSGMTNNNSVGPLPYIRLSPLLVSNISLIMRVCNIPIEMIAQTFLTEGESCHNFLPFNYFSLEDKCSILCNEIRGITFNVKNSNYNHYLPLENNEKYNYTHCTYYDEMMFDT